MTEVNWLNLNQVIDHAKSLGVGWVVFKDTGEVKYGVCKTEDLSAKPRGFEKEKGLLTGQVLPNRGGLFGKPQKRHIIYVVK